MIILYFLTWVHQSHASIIKSLASSTQLQEGCSWNHSKAVCNTIWLSSVISMIVITLIMKNDDLQNNLRKNNQKNLTIQIIDNQ